MIVGSGIDVIEIARIDRALASRPGRFARRVFTEREILACEGRARAASHFALRFAAKEALMKAIGTGWARGVRWVDIETVADGAGLGLHLHGRAAELAEREGGHRLHLAGSRTRTHAMAIVLLESTGP